MHEQLPSGVIDRNISMSLHLHPFFVYASIEGSGESVAHNCESIKIACAGQFHLAGMFCLLGESFGIISNLGVGDF